MAMNLNEAVMEFGVEVFDDTGDLISRAEMGYCKCSACGGLQWDFIK